MATEYNAQKSSIYGEGIAVDVASLEPMMKELIGDVRHLNVVDFGCGNGRFSKWMAQRGARVVYGIDISRDQINLATKCNSGRNIHYFEGNEGSFCNFKSQSVDLVLMNMVFPSLGSTVRAQLTVEGIERVLRPNGRLIASVLHPLYLHPINGRVNDRVTDFSFDRYFEDGHRYSAEALTVNGTIMHFDETHFSIDYLSKLFEKHKLYVSKIRESRLIPELNVRVPVYLAIECRKGLL